MKSIIYVNSAKNVNKDSLIKERSVNRIKKQQQKQILT